MTVAYCSNCKKKVVLKNEHEITNSGGKKYIVGECPYCKLKIYNTKPM